MEKTLGRPIYCEGKSGKLLKIERFQHVSRITGAMRLRYGNILPTAPGIDRESRFISQALPSRPGRSGEEKTLGLMIHFITEAKNRHTSQTLSKRIEAATAGKL